MKPALFSNKIFILSYKASHSVLLHYHSRVAIFFLCILPSLPLAPTLPYGFGHYRMGLSTFRDKKDPQPAARLQRGEGRQESLGQGSSKASYLYLLPFDRASKWERQQEPPMRPHLPNPPIQIICPHTSAARANEMKGSRIVRGSQRVLSPNAPLRANSSYVPAIDPSSGSEPHFNN